MARRQIVSTVSYTPSVRPSRLIRATLFINHPEPAATEVFCDRPKNFTGVRTTASQMGQEEHFLLRDSSRNLHIALDAGIEVAGEETQLQTKNSKFTPRSGGLARDGNGQAV